MDRAKQILIWMILCSNIATASELASYDWEDKPQLHQLTSEELKMNDLIIKEVVIHELEVDERIVQYVLKHQTIKVNTDVGIESHNKIYLPYTSQSSLIQQKARVIKEDGTIHVLDTDDIKEAEDQNTKSKYRYFALEGLEKGSEIEYFHIIRTTPDFTGIVISPQSDVYKKEYSIEFTTPTNIIYAFKSYNGFPDLILDSLTEDKNRWHASHTALQALNNEVVANMANNRMKVHYKLDANTSSNVRNVFTYDKMSKNIYKSVYPAIEKGTVKKLKEIIKKAKTGDKTHQEDKIKALENYVKSNYIVSKQRSESPNDIAAILEQKVASELGMTRLMAALLQELGIKHQLVVTSNRYQYKVDKVFASYAGLDAYLLYFSDLKLFLEPSNYFSRLGYPSYGYTHNNGLFIRPIEIGGIKSGLGSIKPIPALTYDKNQGNMYVEVDFSESITEPLILLRKEDIGHFAQESQIVFDFLEGEDAEKFEEQIAKQSFGDIEIESIEVQNKGSEHFGTKPLLTDVTFISSAFTQKAGDKYLIKIGDLIGPQIEMYQEEVRQCDVETRYNRRFYRTISFDIPEGYTVEGLENVVIDESVAENGEEIMVFISKYTVKGNKVEIEIDEYYKKIQIAVEKFEAYRRVINAAADFNKKVIYFVKK